ncbi:MAG: glycosyl transferase [Clostridia bacterium]|nr:glycosyl transferase [Clostridia bacterium]
MGGKEKPKKIKKCMKTWKKRLKDYEFIEWNEENFDINSNEFVKKMYDKKKWAFVSDYVRAYAIYNYGGIYLDTDVFVIDKLDSLLDNKAFVGFEAPEFPFTAVFGAEKGHPLIKDILEYYDDIKLEGNFEDNNTISVSNLLIDKYGCKTGNFEQTLETGIKVYKDDVLCNPSQNSLTVHVFLGSWLNNTSLKYKWHEFLRMQLNSKLKIKLYCCYTKFKKIIRGNND